MVDNTPGRFTPVIPRPARLLHERLDTVSRWHVGSAEQHSQWTVEQSKSAMRQNTGQAALHCSHSWLGVAGDMWPGGIC